MDYVSVKNFGDLQHYRIKGPLWIKLYTSVLDDYELSLLPEQSRLVYLLLLPLASILGNKISTDRRWLAERLHLPELRKESIEVLEKAGFLLPFDPAALATPETEDEEGHETAEAGDLAPVVPLDAAATTVKQKKKKSKRIDVSAILADPLFLRFWEAYPKKDGRIRAAEEWGRLVRDGIITPEMIDTILSAIARNLQSGSWRLSERQFIPNPSTWLHEQRWTDEGPSAAPSTPINPQPRPLRLAL